VLAAHTDGSPRRAFVPVGRGDVDDVTAALSFHGAHFVLHAQAAAIVTISNPLPSPVRFPVASRNNVVAKLLAATNAKMDKEVKLQGATELAATFP
jgi:hypothetical protein